MFFAVMFFVAVFSDAMFFAVMPLISFFFCSLSGLAGAVFAKLRRRTNATGCPALARRYRQHTD